MAAPCCPWLTIFGEGGSDSGIRGGDAPIQTGNQQQQQPINQAPSSNLPPRQSYLERLRGEQPKGIDVASLPSPVMVGNVPTVTLKKSVVERGRKYCEFSLIGRLDFKKVSLERVKRIAEEVWKPSGLWKVTPLGKGFFMLRLDSKDDFVRIWSQAWKVGDQVLYFSKWSPDFDTDRQKSTSALVWVQFPKLGQQHWDYEALMTIAKGVGTPIGVDKKTISRDLGYFANVLVEVDFSNPIPEYINVKEEDGESFVQDVYIPKPPLFCSHCKSVGHAMLQCRNLQRAFLPGETNQRNVASRQGNANQRVRNAERGATGPGRTQQQQGTVSVPVVQARLIDSLGGASTSTVGVQPAVAVITPAVVGNSGSLGANTSTVGVQPAVAVTNPTVVGNSEALPQREQQNVLTPSITTQTDTNGQQNEVGEATQVVPDGEDQVRLSNDIQGEQNVLQQTQELLEVPGEAEHEVDEVVTTITPMRTLPAGETTIQVTNGFRILGVNEEVPAPLRSVVENAELLNTRINAFLDQNKENSNQQISSSVDKGRQLRGRGRGRPRGSSSSRVNRDTVEASSLGLRRSQRDASTPVRLDL